MGKLGVSEFVGQSFEELSEEEMDVLQGTGDLQTESLTVASYLITLSIAMCFPDYAG